MYCCRCTCEGPLETCPCRLHCSRQYWHLDLEGSHTEPQRELCASLVRFCCLPAVGEGGRRMHRVHCLLSSATKVPNGVVEDGAALRLLSAAASVLTMTRADHQYPT